MILNSYQLQYTASFYSEKSVKTSVENQPQ